MVCPITNTFRDIPFHVPVPDASSLIGYVMAEQIKSVDCASRKAKFVERASTSPSQRGSRHSGRLPLRAAVESEILRHLKEPEAPDGVAHFGRFHRFWRYHVPENSTRSQLGEPLDGLAERFEGFLPVLAGVPSPRLAPLGRGRVPLSLLARFLAVSEEDDVSLRRLFEMPCWPLRSPRSGAARRRVVLARGRRLAVRSVGQSTPQGLSWTL